LPCSKRFLRAEGAEAGNALIHLVAATALTWIAREETPEEAVHVLVDMLTRPKPTLLFDVYVELPWVDSSLARFAGRTLRWQLSRERLRVALPRLVEALEVVDAYDVGEVIQTLLYVAFGREKLPEPIMVQQLTEEQREVLAIIAQSHSAWHPAPDIYAYMSTGVMGPTGYEADPDSVVVMNDDLRALGLSEMQKDVQDFLNSEHEETR